VVGVDLNRIKAFPEENFISIKGDFTQQETFLRIKEVLNGQADVITSDASPKLSGIRDIDQLRSIELVRSVLDLGDELLKNKGFMIIKVFQGEGFPELLKDMKKKFRTVKTTKPPSSRKGSGEMYVLARGFKKPRHINQ
jgi:23S rRNA (uridine2552-2'-O)-methyltransferase